MGVSLECCAQEWEECARQIPVGREESEGWSDAVGTPGTWTVERAEGTIAYTLKQAAMYRDIAARMKISMTEQRRGRGKKRRLVNDDEWVNEDGVAENVLGERDEEDELDDLRDDRITDDDYLLGAAACVPNTQQRPLRPPCAPNPDPPPREIAPRRPFRQVPLGAPPSKGGGGWQAAAYVPNAQQRLPRPPRAAKSHPAAHSAHHRRREEVAGKLLHVCPTPSNVRRFPPPPATKSRPAAHSVRSRSAHHRRKEEVAGNLLHACPTPSNARRAPPIPIPASPAVKSRPAAHSVRFRSAHHCRREGVDCKLLDVGPTPSNTCRGRCTPPIPIPAPCRRIALGLVWCRRATVCPGARVLGGLCLEVVNVECGGEGWGS
ncbi:hypothetical protein K438DRAFT_1978834 [Mycena galopus ATCC 62051]|nr:hypothetical protein K438DRAFT_1978834 [Mycena galopus ATCC 62051]